MAEQQNDQKSAQHTDKQEPKKDQKTKSFVVGGTSDPSGSDVKGNSLGLGTITNTSIGGQPDVASKSREERMGDGGTGEFAIKIDDAPQPGPGVSSSGSSIGAGWQANASNTPNTQQANTTPPNSQKVNPQAGPRANTVGSGSTKGTGTEITDLNTQQYANPATGERADQDEQIQ